MSAPLLCQHQTHLQIPKIPCIHSMHTLTHPFMYLQANTGLLAHSCCYIKYDCPTGHVQMFERGLKCRLQNLQICTTVRLSTIAID